MFGLYEDSRQADGLIVIGSSQNEDAWRYFKGIADAGYSVVFFGSPYATETAIRADNRKGGSLAATHLVDQGCRHIAYIGPPMPAQQQFEARFAGFSETLADHGLAPIIARIPEGETKEEQGAAAVAALLNAGTPFDGIFAVTDLFAIGALQKLQERGVNVPNAVAVVGFDGIRAGLYAYPTLTTIEQDLGRAGEMLVDNVIAAISNAPQLTEIVPVNLQIRGSSRS